MPSLDANALTQDLDGMAFLSGVLGTNDGSAPSPIPGAFDPDASRLGWTVRPSEDDAQNAGQRVWRMTESVQA